MDPIDFRIDADNQDQRREAVRIIGEYQRHVASLTKGSHRLEISVIRFVPRRTDRQNRWYWPCFVKPFGNYMRAQGKEHFTDEMAHEVFKRMFLEISECDPSTGQVFTLVGSSAALTTIEFNQYLDKCAAMLATECGIIVPEPNVYHEPVGVAA